MQNVSPVDRHELGDAEAARISHLDQHTVALGPRRADQQANLNLADDTLGDRSATVRGIGLDLDHGAGVEGRIADSRMRMSGPRLSRRKAEVCPGA